MQKKLIMACASIAALVALAGPSIASASPVLTDAGTAVAVGAEVKGNNTGLFSFSNGAYSVICSTANLSAKVTSNSGTKIRLEAGAGAFTTTGTGTSGDCTTPMGPSTQTWGKICFETVEKTDTLSVTGCGSSLTMTTNITGTVVCKYTAANLKTSFPTNADATFSLSSVPLTKIEGSGAFCPSEIVFSLDFDLTTSGGGTLLIS
jgi:hypothetical protein